MIRKHSAHSTSLPVGFRTWLWRYTCLLLLISMLWHRQAIFSMHACICMHACIHAYIHTYIHFYSGICTGTFLLVIFAWICCDGFESQLRNGYLLKCDCLFDCNWHIGTIKWETKIDSLGWRDRGSNFRPLASRAGALSITLHLIQLIRWFHKNFI